jgi:hypothetical protein
MPIDHESYDQGASLLYASEPFNVTCVHSGREKGYMSTRAGWVCMCVYERWPAIPRSSAQQVCASQDPKVSKSAHTPDSSPYVRAQLA